MQIGLAHWCELHGPTSILCTQIIPPACGECNPPRSNITRSPSTPQLTGGPTPPQSSHGNARPNTTANTPVNSPTPRPAATTTAAAAAAATAHISHLGSNAAAFSRLPSPSETPPASPRSPVMVPASTAFAGGSTPELCRNCTMTLPKKFEDEGNRESSTGRGISPPGRPLRTTETVVISGGGPVAAKGDGERSGRSQPQSSPQVQAQFSSATQSLTTHTHTVTYLSSRSPAQASRYSQVRQACIRSLSCELVPAQTGPILFGDQQTGYTIAVVFKLSDSKSRGGRRTYALLCMSMNQKSLMQSWNVISSVFQSLVHEIQLAAVEKAARDAHGTSTSSAGTSLPSVGSRGPESFLRRRAPGDGSSARSLADLIGNDHFFVNIHSAFVRLLAGLSKIYGYGSAPREIAAEMAPLSIGPAASSDGRCRAGSVSSTSAGGAGDQDKQKQRPQQQHQRTSPLMSASQTNTTTTPPLQDPMIPSTTCSRQPPSILLGRPHLSRPQQQHQQQQRLSPLLPPAMQP